MAIGDEVLAISIATVDEPDLLSSGIEKNRIVPVSYRPFDIRYTYYTGNSRGFIGWPVHRISEHMINLENVAIVTSRQTTHDFKHVFITKNIAEFNLTGQAGKYGSGYVFPLYLYPDTGGQQTLDGRQERRPNFNQNIINQITERLGLPFIPEKEHTSNSFAPIDLFDYVYAVLYSPTYRKFYKEFLKIDFPRIPYPENADTFWRLVKLGAELRQIHLLESPKVEQYITTYPQDGNNTVTRKINKKDYELNEGQEAGRVWINDTQYFDNVPQTAWEFYIGGYQPAQKWLKDRRDRELSFEDILHYQKIIVTLTETNRIMKEIDIVNFME